MQFRLWLKKERCYNELYLLHHNDNGVFAVTCEKGRYFIEEVIIERFTGEFDRNKKPIYENDALRKGNSIFRVIHKNGSFGYKEGLYFNLLSELDLSGFDVIGGEELFKRYIK